MALPEPNPNLSDLQKPLEQFRAKTKRLKVHPAEMRVLWVVCIHLVFLPWAFGGRDIWAHWISLALAIIGFALALIPRDYTEEHTGADRFRLVMWPKLIRFPIFWLGAAFLALIVVQGLNPAWTWETDGKGWWMRRIEHINWLPTGVEAPFARWNPWRVLLVHTSVFLTVCTIWVAFTRRRTLQLLIMTIAMSGVCLGVLGIAQRILRAEKIYGLYHSINPSFFASFVYKNHAGAYLLIPLALTCGLAGWYYLRGLRRLEKSNPSGVLAFAATCIAISVVTSYARGATLTCLAFLFVAVAAFLWHQIRVPTESRKPIVAIALILVFAYFLKNGFEALNSREAWDRLRAGIERKDSSLELREQATAAAKQMLRNHFISGVGAGSFRYVFPVYQHRNPRLVTQHGQRQFWEHAHNDVLQVPIEFGLVGVVLIVAAAVFWLIHLVRFAFWANPVSLCGVWAGVLLVAYSWWDFPFQNPAILMAWCAQWPIVMIWTRLEESSSR